jgi:hypothetical protein
MGELRLYHHVYTSIGGYKTVHASPELRRPVIRALEAFSDTLYPKVRQQTLRSLFHPSPDHICISRIFRSSADHAGRRRSCVHNILFSKSELFEARYVNPFSFPESLFLKTAPDATQALSLHRKLPNSLDLGSPSPADLQIEENILNIPLAQTIFSAVSSNHDMAIVAPSFDCYSFLAQAGDMLPPSVRLSTSVVSGTIYRSTHTEGATIYLLAPGYDTGTLRNEGVITYDTTSGRTANLPAPNRYFSFIAYKLEEAQSPDRRPQKQPPPGSTTLDLSPGQLEPPPDATKQLSGIEKVRRLVALVHRYPITRIATNDMYHNLIKAFTETLHCFKDDGSVDALSDMSAICANLVTFHQAGYSEIVLDALSQAFADLEEKGELSGSADILKQLETSLEDAQVQPVQKEAAINRLAGWLSRTYAKT